MLSEFHKNLQSGDAGSILARLLGIVYFNLGITPNRLDNLCSLYARNVTEDKADAAKIRNNLRSKIPNLSITWRMFIKGLQVARIVNVKFSIETESFNGTKVLHELDVNLEYAGEGQEDE
jgi:hypothetical protein